MKKLKTFFIVVCLFPFALQAQEIISQYPDSIPNAKHTDFNDVP